MYIHVNVSAMEPKSPSKIKLFPTMGFILYKRALKNSVVVSVVTLTLLGVYFAFKPEGGRTASEKSYHTVVVDCGSTGTRVNVFEWVAAGSSERKLPSLLPSYPDNSTKTSLWKNSCKVSLHAN